MTTREAESHSDSPVPVVAFPAPKFCTDCKWCIGTASPECHAPQNFITERSLVTGEIERAHIIQFCSVQRTTRVQGERCGREGKWFQPRTGEGEAG